MWIKTNQFKNFGYQLNKPPDLKNKLKTWILISSQANMSSINLMVQFPWSHFDVWDKLRRCNRFELFNQINM